MSFYPAVPARTLGALRADFARAHAMVVDRSNSKRPARNTLFVQKPDGSQVVRLHETDILVIDKRGTLTLDSGGYQTVTTKERLNSFLPAGFYVYANRGWFIKTPMGTFPYVDGAKFKADGTPCNPRKMADHEKRVSHRKALVAKFLQKAKAQGWDDPAGDPWVFSEPCEAVVMDWLRSGYFTRALCILALKARFQPMGVSMHLIRMERNGNKPDSYLAGQIRRYLYSKIGLPV